MIFIHEPLVWHMALLKCSIVEWREPVFQLRRLARDGQSFPLSKCACALINIIATHESKVKDIVAARQWREGNSDE